MANDPDPILNDIVNEVITEAHINPDLILPEEIAYIREHALKKRSAHVETRSSGPVHAVEGRDPDGVVVMVTHPGPDEEPLHKLPSRIYGW